MLASFKLAVLMSTWLGLVNDTTNFSNAYCLVLKRHEKRESFTGEKKLIRSMCLFCVVLGNNNVFP